MLARSASASQKTPRDIESGRDVQLSDLLAVAKALGPRLELVAENV